MHLDSDLNLLTPNPVVFLFMVPFFYVYVNDDMGEGDQHSLNHNIRKINGENNHSPYCSLSIHRAHQALC